MKKFGGPAFFIDRSDINTDEIIPAKYLTEISKKALQPHLLEDLRLEKQSFDPHSPEMRETRVLITRSNFGCGSSREHAPIAIKASGISCVIAATFARIFYRNAINIGLAIIECPEASERIQEGDEVSVDFDTGVITNLTRKETYLGEPFPPFIQGIIASGGLMNAIRAGKM